jgi:hypothetical protein
MRKKRCTQPRDNNMRGQAKEPLEEEEERIGGDRKDGKAIMQQRTESRKRRKVMMTGDT